jgi:hypothetical protein
MAVSLSALHTGRVLLPTNIIFLLLVSISVRSRVTLEKPSAFYMTYSRIVMLYLKMWQPENKKKETAERGILVHCSAVRVHGMSCRQTFPVTAGSLSVGVSNCIPTGPTSTVRNEQKIERHILEQRGRGNGDSSVCA